MARFNEILAGRYNRFLQKFLSMKGGPPAPQLASELSATWAMFHGRENRYLEAWQLFGGTSAVASVAAQDDVVRLNNPKGSNIIAVIESIKVAFNAVGEAFIEYSSTDPGPLLNPVTPANMDNRSNPPGNGTNGAACSLTGQNNIGAPGFFVFDDIQLAASLTSADLIQYEAQEVPLPPNSAIQIRSATLNINMRVTIRWRERAMEESERS